MPTTTNSEASEAVYSAIEEACELIDVPYSRDKVQPVLTAYGAGVSEESVVVLCMAGGEGHRGDIDYNFTVPTSLGDPYQIAVSNGLAPAADHPASTLLADIAARCSVSFFGVECGVVDGFKKTYVFFPLDQLGDLSALAAIPSMPPAVAEHAATFARYGMDKRVSIVGIDYRHKTMNVYFIAGSLDEKNIRSILSDLDMPEPKEPELLEFIQNSFSIYPTFSWDSSKVKRICFSSVSPDQRAYPTRIDPEIARFAENAPHEYDGPRVLVYGPTITPTEEYYKLGVYYRRPASFWNSLPLAATFEKLVAAKRGEVSKAIEKRERGAAVDSLGGVLGKAGAAAMTGAREQLGESLLRAAFALWEDPEVRPKLLGVLQAALNSEEGAAQMREYLDKQIFSQAGKAIGATGMDLFQAAEALKVPAININAAVAQTWGVVLLRYVVKQEPIASATVDELIDLVSPTIQRYLG
jgi:hypothetical protein